MRALSPALILVVAIACGSMMDATIKHLATTNNVLVVTFGRYLFGALFSFAIWRQAGAPAITREMWKAHALRGLVIALCSTSFFWGLSILPLAQAVTVGFIYPLLIPFVAWVLLSERIRLSSFIIAVLGFIGVVVAAQGAPDEARAPLHNWGVAAILFGAAMFAVAMVLLRDRAGRDGAIIVQLMSSLMPGLILTVPAIAVGILYPPNLSDWPIFLLMGALAATFMYLMAHAYAGAEAQRLAPIHYTELVWATVLGFLLFQEEPRPQIYLGAAIIIATCLYAAYDQRRLGAIA